MKSPHNTRDNNTIQSLPNVMKLRKVFLILPTFSLCIQGDYKM